MDRALVMSVLILTGCTVEDVMESGTPWEPPAETGVRTLRDECAKWSFAIQELPPDGESLRFSWTLELENACRHEVTLRTVGRIWKAPWEEWIGGELERWAYDGAGGHFITRTMSGEQYMISCALMPGLYSSEETDWRGFQAVERDLMPGEIIQWTHEYTEYDWLGANCRYRPDHEANVSLILPRLSSELPSTPFKLCDQMDERRYGWTLRKNSNLPLSDELVVWPLGTISPETPHSPCSRY